MPDLWMPGATRLDTGDHSPTDGGEPRAIAHITWDRNATAARPQDLVPYETLAQYFGRNPAGVKAAPHILWDPFTGRRTQFLPATSRSKSLADRAGGTRTNRTGDVCIQIEALFFPYCRVNGRVFPRLVDTPCAGWQELLAWVRSWGVPDVWPMGRPVDFASRRSEQTWRTRGGWYAHAHVPENDHQDPGSWPDFVRAGSPAPTPETPEEDDMAIYGPVQLEKGVVGDASAKSVPLTVGAARVEVSANYVPPGEKVRIRLDELNANGSVRQGNKVFEFVNGQWGFLDVLGPGTIAVQRLDHPDAHVSFTVVTGG